MDFKQGSCKGASVDQTKRTENTWIAPATHAKPCIKTENYEISPSTQIIAREKAEKLITGQDIMAMNEWLLIRSACQTHAFGQNDRTWFSPVGHNLYLTYVIPWPHTHTHTLAHLSQTTVMAVAQTVEAFELHPQIKWINDVFLNGKKICGVLCEKKGTIFQRHYDVVLIGIGLNVNMPQACIPYIDQPITSMAIETGKPFAMETVLERLNQNLLTQYQLLIHEGFSALHPYIQRHMLYLGEWVKVENQDKEVYGLFEGLTPSGAIILRTAHGTSTTLCTGRMFKIE
ncbi:MAG TPA: biotin--[acetyl-CoA-carboxylase] ligase [Amoebophilaceae bacterium]|nr:biotin--[acetyl-CoA-carboxylase] ligase [Amoebophilaceae bacterium]